MASGSTNPNSSGSIRLPPSLPCCSDTLRHDIHIPGHAFRLRPVREADAAYIVALRSRAGAFLNRGAPSEDTQLQWLARYFDRAGDYYFVVESANGWRREGLVGVYDVRASARIAEWGRWLLEPGSNAAVESALLIYRCAFDRLRLERVRCRTLSANAAAVAFHDSCGLARTPGDVFIEHNGEHCPAVEHVLSRGEWSRVGEQLESLARRFAATIARVVPPRDAS
jgi:RimJ/RimL family protein N-acetyltransferase